MDKGLVIDGRYKIENPKTARIGEGGMGTVYRGLDIQTRLPIAIKHL